MPRAVLFDFNGVLVDDEGLHFETLRDALGEAGVAITEAEYWTTYLALDDRAAVATALERAGRPPTETMAIAARKAALYAARTAGGVPWYPGAVEAVRALGARYPLAIVSGAVRSEVEPALADAGLDGLFCVVIAADDVAASKPDPAGYLLALDRLAAALGETVAPGRCVAVEDSPGGVAAARAAGLKVIAVAHTVRPERLIGADLVLKTIAEVTPLEVERLVP